MEPINYRMLVNVYCSEEPTLNLVGVCNYDLFVTQQRISGIHRELVHLVNRAAERFDVTVATRDEASVLFCDLFFIPIDPTEMSVPDPKASPFARLPKSVNTCINVCMKDAHSVLYPLMKPVG